MSSIHVFNVCCSRFRWQLIATVTDGRCRQHTSHAFSVHIARAEWWVAQHIRSSVCTSAFHLICMVIHVVRLSVLWLSVPHLVPLRVFLLSFLLPGHWPVPLPPCGRHRGNIPLALRQMRSLALWPKTPLTGYDSKLPDDFTTQRLVKSSSRSNPGRPVHELSSLSSCSREKPSRDSENERIRILFERQKEQILAGFRAEIQKHEFQADSDRRSIRELSGIIEFQRREIDHALTGDEQLRRDQQLLHEQLSEQNWDLREAYMKTHNEMEELKRFQGSTFDELSRKDWSKIETPSLNSQPEFRNYRMKLIVCFERFLEMLNQYAVDCSTFPVNLRFSHLFQILVEC